VTAVEVAAALGLNERTVRRAIQDGRLVAEKRGGRFEIDFEQARDALLARRPADSTYQLALADALHLLRAFAHEADAQEIEARYGLVYVEPRPEVRRA
jgi:excisionase family DNA binding protein